LGHGWAAGKCFLCADCSILITPHVPSHIPGILRFDPTNPRYNEPTTSFLLLDLLNLKSPFELRRAIHGRSKSISRLHELSAYNRPPGPSSGAVLRLRSHDVRRNASSLLPRLYLRSARGDVQIRESDDRSCRCSRLHVMSTWTFLQSSLRIPLS
jgi:hypothetical protein